VALRRVFVFGGKALTAETQRAQRKAKDLIESEQRNTENTEKAKGRGVVES